MQVRFLPRAHFRESQSFRLAAILGVKTNSRFRILGEENFLIQEVREQEAANVRIFCCP